MNNNTSPFLQRIAIVVSLVILSGLLLTVYLVTPISFEEKWREVEIPEGSSYTRGVNILLDNGILSDKLFFSLLGRITNADRLLKPGFYHLSASMSPLQIFENLIQGRVIGTSVTVPEGFELKDIKKRFLKANLIDDESWQLVYDDNLLSSLAIDAPSLEGYIYPDTYTFSRGTNPRIIFKVMVQRLRELFDESLLARAAELGMSENEVVTLASIIEKEAVFDSERELISAVYHNRLKKNMRLQADPTVLYGIKDRWKRIRYRDLKRDTPYNTYKIKGLPPGPIASPGIKSIMAALYPADADYLFFVAKNNGKHYFSTTDAEHTKAVVQYQLNGYNKFRKKKEKTN